MSTCRPPRQIRSTADSPEPIVVSIDKEGLMYLNISVDPDSGISAESLVKQVKSALVKEPKRPGDGAW